MSLARAFTRRMNRRDDTSSTRLGRGNTVHHMQSPMQHIKISSPIELLSTTNVHALTAPDIRKIGNTSSSGSSTHSNNDSDFSTIDRSFLSSNGDSDSSPATPITPPMDHKDFFESIVATPTPAAPQIPQRSPSHSKKAHVELSRKRSIQRMSPPPTTLQRAASVRDSCAMFSPLVEEQAFIVESQSHPFGAELAQVNEVAEEFGASVSSVMVLDDEEQEMLSKGLCKFGVQDYLNEIAGLYGGVYENQLGFAANPWI